LLVHVTASYKNPFTVVDTRTFNLNLVAQDASGNVLASSIKSESILAYPGQTGRLTDDIAVSYPARATGWKLTFGGAATTMNNCSISAGSGSLGGANATASVSVSCN
jgi:hypothetical protein